jgi:hypothetical protein
LKSKEQRLAELDQPEFDKLVDVLMRSPKYRNLDLPDDLKAELIKEEYLMSIMSGSDQDPGNYIWDQDENGDDIQPKEPAPDDLGLDEIEGMLK